VRMCGRAGRGPVCTWPTMTAVRSPPSLIARGKSFERNRRSGGRVQITRNMLIFIMIPLIAPVCVDQ
jgi:hypothetical protein